MSTLRRPLRVGVIRAQRIVAQNLQIRSGGPSPFPVRNIVRDLRVRIRHLEHEVRELEQENREIERQLHELRERVKRLEAQISSGQPANPALQALFTSKQGQVVTVSTASGTLTGTVTLVGTNAVELTESNGDILVIPYSKITGVQ
ncbi:hypothetical protein [Ferroacidibacillus organovorans]|uniref:DUF2642 domain-containing protein n=1 Tax=Ferroacidibacillus organovorans TaxID=1765683 RepID=A0A101XRN8_9BACL|nr:hypothetical protein [Ferroacidibacillus organovorans]KUO96282.1 hypothetical protein ATW55_03470 [Ferroacidibacillus organovorans]